MASSQVVFCAGQGPVALERAKPVQGPVASLESERGRGLMPRAEQWPGVTCARLSGAMVASRAGAVVSGKQVAIGRAMGRQSYCALAVARG